MLKDLRCFLSPEARELWGWRRTRRRGWRCCRWLPAREGACGKSPWRLPDSSSPSQLCFLRRSVTKWNVYRTFECILPTSPKLPAVGTKTPSIISSEILFLVMRILKNLTGQLWTLTYKLCRGCWSASITVVFRHQLFSSILKLFCPLGPYFLSYCYWWWTVHCRL